MALTLLVLIFIILSLCDSLPAPRNSFLLHSTVRPVVHFRVPDLNNTITLLLSTDGSTLYVGAQNAVLSLDVSRSDVIDLKQKVTWKPSEEKIQRCGERRKNAAVDCQNFVHVLRQINSSHLYVCGSFAFSPRVAFIDIKSFSLVEDVGAKGPCPFSLVERASAITVDGELFTATTIDFKGVIPQISRFLSKDGRPNVNLDSSSSVSLLNEPQFVGSPWDDAEGKLLFFFTEVGKEFNFVDELQIPRVAQVCKDDVGGQRTLQRKWTSFSKAPLLCQSHKQLPFNVLRDVFTLGPAGGHAPHTLFYGVFTSQWSEDRGSAVCVFRLEDVRSTFKGSFKALDLPSGRWKTIQRSHLGKCGLANASDSDLEEVKKSFLTSDSVRPVGGAPLVVSDEERYSRVAAMKTKAANGQEFTVLFLLTDSGFLHKVVLFDEGPRVLEEVQVFSSPQQLISVVLSPSKEVVYVGTSEGVTAVPTAQCSTSRTCFQCVLSRDPQCGWSPTGRVCTAVEGSQENLIQTMNGSNPEDACGQTEAPVVQKVVGQNEVVRLECVRPSSVSTVSWIYNTSEQTLIHQDDGSLLFHASVRTVGTYHCGVREGEYREALLSYEVRLSATPPQEEEETRTHAVTERGKHYAVTECQLQSGRSFHSELVVVSLLLVCCVCVLVLVSLYVLRLRRIRIKEARLVGAEGENSVRFQDGAPTKAE